MKQNHVFKALAFSLFMLALAGCQVFGGSNPAATLEANNNTFITEATTIAVTAAAFSTEVVSTAAVIETQVGQLNTVNQHLLATVMAGSSPTPRVVVGSADPSSGGVVSETGQVTDGSVQPVASDGSVTQFSQITKSASVRQSDGCADGIQNQFSLDTNRIYITAVAANLSAGTIMSAEWVLNGTVMVTNSAWTVDQNYPSICVWFFITQDDTVFTPGDWSARLLVNNVPVEPASAFTIVGQ